MKEEQKKNETETKIAKMEGELIRLQKDLSVAKEKERLELLREEEDKLRKNLEKILASGKEDPKLEKVVREKSEEIWVQEKRIQGLQDQRDAKAESIKAEIMAQKRLACETYVPGGFERVKKLESQLTEEFKKLVCASIIHDRNVPRRWCQISAKKFIRMERVRKPQTFSKDLGPIPPPGPEIEFVELYKVSRLQIEGWRVEPPNQDITPEVLSQENSILVSGISVPSIISEIEGIFVSISFADAYAMVTEEDILNFEKKIE